MINILLSLRAFDRKDIKKALKPYITSDKKVCVLAYSFFKMFYATKASYESYYSEQGPYYEKLLNSFSVFGTKELIWVDYYKDSREDAIKKIASADIIYLPGGAPDEMMKRIKEKNLLEALTDTSKTYIGVSAGTMIQFEDYYIAPDHEYSKFSEEKGLGLIKDFYIDVHYRRRIKQKSSMRKVWKKYRKEMYIIPNDGCIILDKNQIKCVGTATQLYNRKGIIK
jgi:peptidase E